MKHDIQQGLGRRLLAFALLFSSCMPYAGAVGLPSAQDLVADSQLAQRQRLPILVFFSADSCAYCELVRELYLEPMYSSGEYKDKILFRVVHIESRNAMRDFHGRSTDHYHFAGEQGVSFTPIIRLYDFKGQQLTPELFGYTSPDFYAGYLEDAIERSRLALSQRHP